MHDCIYLLCFQDVAQEVTALYVTFDELQQTHFVSACKKLEVHSTSNIRHPYFEVWVVLSKSQVVQRGAVIQLVHYNDLQIHIRVEARSNAEQALCLQMLGCCLVRSLSLLHHLHLPPRSIAHLVLRVLCDKQLDNVRCDKPSSSRDQDILRVIVRAVTV